MLTLAFPTIAFALLVFFAYRLSRGIVSLPTICMLYLTCIFIGGLRLWLQDYSNTYLYVLAAAAAFVLGVALTRAFQRRESSKVIPGRSRAKKMKHQGSLRAIRGRPDVEGTRRFGSREVVSGRPEFSIGVHPQVLLYTLISLTALALMIWGYWIWKVGVPLINGNPSVGWVDSSAGAVQRLLGSLGGGNLAFVGLGWYALYRARPRHRSYLLCAASCIIGAAMFMAFEGSKGSAIMTVLWFAIVLFYFNRRMPKLKTLLLMAVFAIPVTWWVCTYYRGSYGEGPASIVYNRVTTGELAGLNFLIQTWVPRYGLLHGHTFSMDIARIRAQFEGGPRPVLFHEYIWNIVHEASPYKSRRLSESLTLFGVGYANYGLWGGLIFMFLFGSGCEILDAKLMTVKKIHFLNFAIAMYLVMQLLGILQAGDVLVIGVEQFLITVVPKVCSFSATYAFFALPFRIPLNWPRGARKRQLAPETGEISRRAGGRSLFGSTHG